MLHHHDGRRYEDAARHAADWARAKLEKTITEGKAKAAAVINKVENEQPTDLLVRAHAVGFEPSESGVGIDLVIGKHQRPLHQHALKQAANKGGVPWTYVRRLLDSDNAEWGAPLLATNLREVYAQQFAQADCRLLVRSCEGQVRGILSDRFRRLDSRPIVDAFAKACSTIGAVPMDGYATATKVGLRAMLPTLFEPVENEVMAFGVSFENSDYGHGALSLRIFCLRLWCSNLAIADESIRAIHLGPRLADDFAWSDETYRLDTERMCSAVQDVVSGQLSPGRIAAFQDVIREADASRVDPAQVGRFLKNSLSKAGAERVAEAFRSTDVLNLPPGDSRWRLSNAISWVAHQEDDPETRADLQKLAGKVLPNPREA